MKENTLRTKHAFGLILVSLLWALPSVAEAQDLIPVELFAQLPVAKDLKISPDGKFYVSIALIEDEHRLLVLPTDGTTDGARVVNYGELTPGFFRWAGNRYIVIEISYPYRRQGIKTVETRLAVIDIESGELDNLVKFRKQNPKARKKHYSQLQNQVVSYLPDDDAHLLLALDETEANKPDVVRIKLKSSMRSRVLRFRSGISEWLADARGNVRMGWGYRLSPSGYQTKELKMIFREDAEEDFRELDIYDSEGGRISVEDLTEEPHIILVSKFNKKGRDSLYKLDTRTMTIVDTVFSHDQYDYDGFRKAPNSDRLIAVYYYADKLETVHLDEAGKSEAASLRRIVPGLNSSIVSESSDGTRLIIESSSPIKPARHYYIDTNTKAASLIAMARPQLELTVASMPEPISYIARDGLKINGYLTIPHGAEGKNLPMIVHPHGGPRSRDVLRYDYWVQYFTSRGWAVLQMNFRGSSGYGRTFQRKGYHEWGLAMQDDITDGVQWAIDQGIADPARICIVGASYGGYAAIEGAVKTPDLYKCAVGLNGVYDIKDRLASARHYLSFRRQRDYMNMDNADEISPSRNVDAIKIPVMIAYGEDDRTVDAKQSTKLISKLKKNGNDVVSLKLKDGDHYLSKAPNRLKFFREMDTFLQKHLGLGPVPMQPVAE
jgi:dienelactone hydrolase